MKRDVSWGVTAAVALAAVIGISSLHGGSPEADTSAPSAAADTKQPVAPQIKDQFEQGPCTAIEKHLQNFLISGKTESRAAPLSCYPQLKVLPTDEQNCGDELRRASKSLKFVIATLPDPAHTHFSLLFDRATEAIQEGVSDDRFVYDSSWLPWGTEKSPYALIVEQDMAEDRKERQEEQPGNLFVRHQSYWTDSEIKQHLVLKQHPALQPDEIFGEGLVVFIVGEEPTQGIHRKQFMDAAA